MLNIVCEDIMCANPITVKDNISVGDVTHLLLRYRINGILVVKKDNPKQLVGIYTTTDSLKLIDQALESGSRKMEELKKISQIPVGEVATCQVKKIQKDDKVTKAIALMHRENIHTIPVYDKEELVGVLGRHDLLNVALSSD
jgi:CBS domain-containing protein